MTARTNEQEIARRIKGYLQRTRRERTRQYPLNEVGIYRIVGGSQGDRGERKELAIVQGRYIDALEFAVQQPGFLGDWCSWSMPENCNHGYVERVQVKELRITNQSLINLVEAGGRT